MVEQDFSYREVSAISDATDDVYAESPSKDPDADLNDYNRLVHNTQQRLKLLGKQHATDTEQTTTARLSKSSAGATSTPTSSCATSSSSSE